MASHYSLDRFPSASCGSTTRSPPAVSLEQRLALPAVVGCQASDSNAGEMGASPRWGEKASYYSAVCLETGEVEVMEMEGNSNAGTSTAFLKQLRENTPAH